MTPQRPYDDQHLTDPEGRQPGMRNSTRRISRFVTAYFGAAFQVVVMGSTGRLAAEAGVIRRDHTT
ncbi:hypothetical protein OHB00_27360 [Streptomyces sp. NBC_00631]|uniref:hypothetical protein n=1 Tax=Streptomyces sp. NBC_00631 TaxID=2975793 RepID=UPI0030E47305